LVRCVVEVLEHGLEKVRVVDEHENLVVVQVDDGVCEARCGEGM
jgi:hypothetical protein